MALFNSNVDHKVSFDKEKVIEEIKDMLKDYPDWHVMKVESVTCDLVLMRKVLIQEEITIRDNPFHIYKNINTSIYQVIIGVYMDNESKDYDKRTQDQALCLTTVQVDSSKALARVLKKYN